MSEVRYHPDNEINAEIIQDSIEAERCDLEIGYPPRAWTCRCGATHTRGHFGAIGTHRCLRCGYVGTEGVMHGSALGGMHAQPEPFSPSPVDHHQPAARAAEEDEGKDEVEQISNRLAMWRDLILRADDPLGPTIEDLLDSLVADVTARIKDALDGRRR